jgi:hypothetical protein
MTAVLSPAQPKVKVLDITLANGGDPTMQQEFDAIVVEAGVNGLACGARRSIRSTGTARTLPSPRGTSADGVTRRLAA